jgi:hypothetical protein
VYRKDPLETEKSSVRAIADQAIQFISAYDRCMEERRMVGETHNCLPMAAAMCGAFALEITLKALLLSNQISIPKEKSGAKTHNLHLLYSALPGDVQNKIGGVLDIPHEAFSQMLGAISRLFEQARYTYEKEELAVDLKFLHTLIILAEPLIWKISGRTPPAQFADHISIRRGTLAHKVDPIAL